MSTSEMIIGVQSATHGFASFSINSNSNSFNFLQLKNQVEKFYNESLNNYCFIMKPSNSSNIIELNDNLQVKQYLNQYSQPISIVPKNTIIQLKSPANIITNNENIQITIPATNLTLNYIKQQIYNHLHIPPQFQLLICGGKILVDEHGIIQLPILNENVPINIEVLVDEKFQTFHPKAQFRDPIGGYLITQPIVANHRKYSKPVLDDWIKGPHIKYCPFNTVIRIHSTNVIDEEFQNLTKDYLSTIDINSKSNITTLNHLGESFSVLETVKSYLHEMKADSYLSEWGLDFIPALVILGDEKMGKSSLMARLSMLSLFPINTNKCTTVVTIIKFRRGEAKAPKFKVFHHEHLANQSKPIAAAVADSVIIQEMPESLSRDKHFEIEITHPFAPNLDLYDYPGVTSVGDDGPILEMLNEHIKTENKRSMYIYTINSMDVNRNPESAARERINKIFQKYPQILDRTIAVFTQADRASLDRLKELIELPVSDKYIIGHDLKWGHIITAAHCGGYENFNIDIDDDNNNDRFNCLETQAINEPKFLSKYPHHGSDQLICKIESIQNMLLKEYYEKCTNKLNNKKRDLIIEYENLGLPAAHEYNYPEDKEPICNQFVYEISTLLHTCWNEILRVFESEYLNGICLELRNIFENKNFSTRIQVDNHIENIKEIISNLRESYYERELEFWSTQIYKTLSKEDSPFKIKRFSLEIEKVAKDIQLIVKEHHKKINKRLDKFLDLHFDNFSGLIKIIPQNLSSNSNSSSSNSSSSLLLLSNSKLQLQSQSIPKNIVNSNLDKTFNLEFDSQLSELLVQIFSATLSCFRDPSIVFSTIRLKEVLKSSPFIEANREDRYDLLQQMKLLDITLEKLLIIQKEANCDEDNDNEDDNEEDDDEDNEEDNNEDNEDNDEDNNEEENDEEEK